MSEPAHLLGTPVPPRPGDLGDADPAAPVLQVQGVTRRYPGRGGRGAGRRRVVALDGVSLDVWRGDRLGVVGESGSGKSTLARLLLALEEPDEGVVRFRGTVVSGARRAALGELRRNVQIVFQDPLGSLDPRMSVGTSIAEPLRSLEVEGAHDRRVVELLGAVGLPPSAARRYPHQLSGGQRQRVAIARALAPRPSVLVADEAVSALDVSVRAQVLNLLDDLVERYGLTLVFISHDLGVVRHVANRVVVLYQGRVVEEGPADAVYDAPAHPYTRALLDSVPRVGGTIASRPPGATAGGSGRAGDDPGAGGSPGTGCAYAPRCPLAADRCAREHPALRGPEGSLDGPLRERRAACHLAFEEHPAR